jgi:hypothetical protein
MQVNPAFPRHIRTKECQVGVERRAQRESAVASALALRRQFTVHEDALERVEVYKYLSRLLAQDDDNAQAIRQQLRKARGVWARVGQVLRGENTSPRVAAKFYKAVVQAVLLYGSETWNLTKAALARLEGFHICAAYKMARVHRPKKGAHGLWQYPKSAEVLEECGMRSIAEYIQVRGRQLLCTWRIAQSWRPANRAIGNVDQCPDSGGGSSRWSWTGPTMEQPWLTLPRTEDGAEKKCRQPGRDHSVWN